MSGLTAGARGATLSPMPDLVCHHCGSPVRFDEPLGRDRTCDACGGDLRCCINCRHHDPRYHNQCMEPMADPVEDRARRNFCEYFSYARTGFAPDAARGGREAAARAKLESLFGGGAGSRPEPDESAAKPGPATHDRAAEARRKLDALFKPKPPDDD